MKSKKINKKSTDKDFFSKTLRHNRLVTTLFFSLVFFIVIGGLAMFGLNQMVLSSNNRHLSALIKYSTPNEVVDDTEFWEKLKSDIKRLKNEIKEIDEMSQVVDDGIDSKEKQLKKLKIDKTTYDAWFENRYKIVDVNGIETFLVMCVDDLDHREGAFQVAEMFTMITFDRNSGHVTVANIRPEMYVYIPEIGTKRLADAYNYGNVELVIKTIEENLGISISRFFLAKYTDFVDVINLNGGVDVSVSTKEAKAINELIDELSIRNRFSKKSETVHLAVATGVQRLDGVQTVSYLRYFVQNDLLKGDIFQNVSKTIFNDVMNMPFYEAFFEMYPKFSTGFSRKDMRNFWLNLPEYFQYDVEYIMLPKVEEVAPFKVSYKDLSGEEIEKTVVLNQFEETNAMVDQMLSSKVSEETKDFFNPLEFIIIIYAILFVCSIVWLVYLSLFRKRRIIYTDVKTGKVYRSEKKYRRGQKAHPYYHARVIDGKVMGLFADYEMKVKFEQETKMPMRKLYVYCDVIPFDRTKGEKEEVIEEL